MNNFKARKELLRIVECEVKETWSKPTNPDVTLSRYIRFKNILPISEENMLLNFISNEEIINLERNSYCLVNPKLIDNEISRVTFPSKIHEYLTNNAHIISTRLSGVNKDYYNFMIPTENDTVEAHKIAIINALKETDFQIEEKSKIIKNYAMEFLTWEKKALELYQFLIKIIREGQSNEK
jgi:hypothetical protein